MDKVQMHVRILDFLDNYLKTTPINVIKQEFKEISKIKYEGTTAEDYFKNFHKYYTSSQQAIPLTILETRPDILSLDKIDIYIDTNSYNNQYMLMYQWHQKQEELIISEYNSFSNFAPKNYQETIKNYNHV